MTDLAAPGDHLMELVGVSRTYGEVTALQPTDLVIARGEYLALTGRSGSGKSTLLHLLGLLDRPSAGSMRFAGQDLATFDDPKRTSLRSREIGFVFQAFHLVPARSAVENVELGLLYQHVGRRERRERARAALERVGLSHREWAFPTTLSGGERQRVAIARAIASEPSLLLADEPTGNLDSDTGGRILDLFEELHESNLTIVVVTHDAEVASRASAVCAMSDGLLRKVDAASACA